MSTLHELQKAVLFFFPLFSFSLIPALRKGKKKSYEFIFFFSPFGAASLFLQACGKKAQFHRSPRAAFHHEFRLGSSRGSSSVGTCGPSLKSGVICPACSARWVKTFSLQTPRQVEQQREELPEENTGL